MNPYLVRNVYNASLGSYPSNVTLDLLNTPAPVLINQLLNSHEFREISQKRENSKPKNYSSFDYCIISVNDRAANTTVKYIDTVVTGHRFHKMNYFMATEENYKQFFETRGIKFDWKPEFSFNREEPLIGEFGICGSVILVLEYMVENNIPEMIVFEDDVVLTDKFIDYLNLCYDDLPEDYDFLADTTVFPNDRILASVHQESLIDSDFIYKSYLQNAHLGFMLYSLKGAKKIISLLKEHGIFAPIDSMLFHYSRAEELDGYSTFFFNRLIADKDIHGSLIDEYGIRR